MSETKESLLEKIASKVSKVILSSEKTKLEKAKLVDGTEVEIDGKEIFVIADNERLPAPVGEHTLEDGKVVVVEEEGQIKEIKEAEAEEVEAEKEDEKMEFASKEEMNQLKTEVEELKAMMEPKEELSKEEPKKEEPKKEELSKEEPKKLNHSPEKKSEKKINLYSAKQTKSTKGRVYAKLFK